jgi:hypothetical protein
MFGAPTSGELSSFSLPKAVAAGVAASVAASGDGGAISGSVVPVMEGPQLCLQLPVATAQLQVPRDELERGASQIKSNNQGIKRSGIIEQR